LIASPRYENHITRQAYRSKPTRILVISTFIVMCSGSPGYKNTAPYLSQSMTRERVLSGLCRRFLKRIQSTKENLRTYGYGASFPIVKRSAAKIRALTSWRGRSREIFGLFNANAGMKNRTLINRRSIPLHIRTWLTAKGADSYSEKRYDLWR